MGRVSRDGSRKKERGTKIIGIAFKEIRSDKIKEGITIVTDPNCSRVQESSPNDQSINFIAFHNNSEHHILIDL